MYFKEQSPLTTFELKIFCSTGKKLWFLCQHWHLKQMKESILCFLTSLLIENLFLHEQMYQ